MKLILWPKHHNYSQNRAYPRVTKNSPLSPFSGALLLQFAPGTFHKFISLYLMVLYQLESIHLIDYNLIYSQNKNRGFDKFLIAFPLKTKHFPFYKHSSKPIQTNTKIHLQPIQNTFIQVFPNPNTREKGLGFSFLPLNLLILRHQAFLVLLDHLETINGKISHHNLGLLSTLALFSLPFLSNNENAQLCLILDHIWS